MARDLVAVTALASGAAVANPAGVAIAPANGATLAAVGDRIVVRVQNTTAATKKVTIKAGTTNPPAMRKGLGDLVVTMLEKTDALLVLETARFSKPDGTVDVDYEAAMTGFLSAVQTPKGA